MRLPVGEVIILIAQICIGDLPGQSAGNGIVAAGVIGLHIGWTNNHLRANGLEDVHFFFRLFIGGRKNAFIALDDGCQGQAHPRIAGGAFNNGTARFEFAFFFRHFHHFQGHTVLDGVTRVEIIYFGDHLAGEVLCDLIQPDQWRVSNRFENMLFDIHGAKIGFTNFYATLRTANCELRPTFTL